MEESEWQLSRSGSGEGTKIGVTDGEKGRGGGIGRKTRKKRSVSGASTPHLRGSAQDPAGGLPFPIPPTPGSLKPTVHMPLHGCRNLSNAVRDVTVRETTDREVTVREMTVREVTLNQPSSVLKLQGFFETIERGMSVPP